MRERRILYVLALIVLVGAGVTFCTNHFLGTGNSAGSGAGAAAAMTEEEMEADPEAADELPEMEADSAVEEEMPVSAVTDGGGPASAAEDVPAEEDGEEPDAAMAEEGEAAAGGRMAAAEKAAGAGGGMAVTEKSAQAAGRMDAAEKSVQAAGAGAPEGAGPEAADSAIAGAEEESKQARRNAEAAAGMETVPETTVAISPLETAAPKTEDEAAKEPQLLSGKQEASAGVNPYRQRLQELDARINRTRGGGDTAEARNSANTGVTKTQASDELRLWDSELSVIYNELLSRLGDEQSETLVSDQREWLKSRDAAAVEAAKSSAGGSQESVEYTLSMASSTRDRAYKLVSLYENVLME